MTSLFLNLWIVFLFRISSIEQLDEIEEWNLLASHYCIARGFKFNCAAEKKDEILEKMAFQ